MGDDQRPYLKVDVLGKELIGLLDSGATHTFMPRGMFDKLKLKLMNCEIKYCSVGNGSKLNCYGECQIPITMGTKT